MVSSDVKDSYIVSDINFVGPASQARADGPGGPVRDGGVRGRGMPARPAAAGRQMEAGALRPR